MAAGPRYMTSARTAQKTPLPTVTRLLHVTQPLPSNGCFYGFTILALGERATIWSHLSTCFYFLRMAARLYIRTLNNVGRGGIRNEKDVCWTQNLHEQLWRLYYWDAWLRVGRPTGRSSSPSGVKILFSSRRPDRLWRPPSFLYNGYWGLFPLGKAAGAWSWPLTTN
jgi:hypothetical protein